MQIRIKTGRARDLSPAPNIIRFPLERCRPPHRTEAEMRSRLLRERLRALLAEAAADGQSEGEQS